ncbi:MAG TPA: cytochrome b5 domain-containing protein [Syntrophales bacterium]|nr:cytochrome b5 domain-containing protein [Syntrophales bacterium]
MKEFDPETVARFDGKEGRPAYIAHRGRVFDVSGSRLWKAGLHMNRHAAGRDLTADMEAAPHGVEVLDRYPQVGTLQMRKEAAVDLPGPLAAMLKRFPFLRRHPHPMTVHFPIAFTVSPGLFYLLYLLTGVRGFETTSFFCLGAGIVFTVPGALTGFLTWWINYQARPLRAVRIKMIFSTLLLSVSLCAFLLRLLFPVEVLSVAGMEMLYVLLLLALIPIVSVVGWFGATLTFPIGEE